MGNCLITRLKSSVDASLPTFNKIILDYVAPRGVDNNDALGIFLITGATGPLIKVKKTAQIMEGGSGTIEPNIDYQLSPNTTYQLNIYEIPLTNIPNYIEITNFYDLKKFAIKDTQQDEWYICSGNLNDQKSGLESLYRMAPLEVISIHAPVGVEGYKFSDSLQKVALDVYGADGNTVFDVDNLIKENLQHLEVKNANISEGYIKLTDKFLNSNIYYINALCNGNISELPNKLEFLNVRGRTVGSIENLVAKFRAAGRTSGSLWIFRATNSGITYNGTPLAQLWDAGELPKDGQSTYLTWTADSMEFTNVKPAVLEKYSIYSSAYWTPYY